MFVDPRSFGESVEIINIVWSQLIISSGSTLLTILFCHAKSNRNAPFSRLKALFWFMLEALNFVHSQPPLVI
jgi:hypothetical protein